MISLPYVLSPLQKEILLGNLLGDGHLETQTNGKSYRFCWSQSSKKHLSIEYMQTVWKNMIPLNGHTQRVYSKGLTTVGFRTRFSSVFIEYADMFYREKKKHVPIALEHLLTSRGLAFWYMDDGSIKSKHSKGAFLNTQSFLLNDIEILCEILERKFGMICWLRPQNHGTQYQIYISGKSYELLAALITPYFTEDMWYKFPAPRKEKVTKLPKE